MKKLLFTTFIICLATRAFCQQAETDAVKATINTMFDAMRKGDSVMLNKTFHKSMVLQSVANKKDGTVALITEKPEEFAKAVGTPHKEVWDERITYGAIKIDGALASVWTPYKFYVDDKFSHCGVNFFQLMKTETGWKIIYIVDTRRKDNCPE
ncbi:nuclear transport factor 2 family protein [Mucilaginibacter gynuensis]|uniref:Nuclear transport factor 2 family protein n=1 Tax=Mucilaginibacter gynuensis TaxID=1302236 RepID=A0ABP8HEF4_9SPHI